MLYNFSLRLNMAKCKHVFLSALCPETEKQIKLVKNITIALICSLKKVIQTLPFRGNEKYDNLFYFKLLGIVR